jgi:hypothetical protein
VTFSRYNILGITLQIFKHAGIDTRLYRGVLGDALAASVHLNYSDSRCDAQTLSVGQPQGGTHIMASCCPRGCAYDLKRNHALHAYNQAALPWMHHS